MKARKSSVAFRKRPSIDRICCGTDGESIDRINDFTWSNVELRSVHSITD